MDSTTHLLIEILLGLVAFFGGWVLYAQRDDIRKLQEKLQNLEVEIPKTYPTKNDFRDMLQTILDKLKHIESKLDAKVDKE